MVKLAIVIIALGVLTAIWAFYETWVYETKRIDLVIPPEPKP